MATKIPPGRARLIIADGRLQIWQPTRAERIALDIARQKNAEFLAIRKDAPLVVSDSTIDSLKRLEAEDAELLAKREAETAQAAPAATGLLHDEDALHSIERAADLLEGYAEFIKSDVMAADIERHPYLPEVEGVAEELRELSALAAPLMPCGHSRSLMLRSAETGEPLYCEACDDKSGRRDAEEMELALHATNKELSQ